ncbi:hypothetical protein IV203_024130 [Nitzschia inconspicua]|uniref:Uncharacterized protein n=1 Tax=Nitzschia inconspicua TaxID=303405 RepID=A0A9K3K4B5_9STRA|nr:hypothetical protein IV203_024569 [Nitzschia inconspicua]KAG7340587.1 hypothetical protein IV203_024130 [Nitzschia inconspicua]
MMHSFFLPSLLSAFVMSLCWTICATSSVDTTNNIDKNGSNDKICEESLVGKQYFYDFTSSTSLSPTGKIHDEYDDNSPMNAASSIPPLLPYQTKTKRTTSTIHTNRHGLIVVSALASIFTEANNDSDISTYDDLSSFLTQFHWTVTVQEAPLARSIEKEHEGLATTATTGTTSSFGGTKNDPPPIGDINPSNDLIYRSQRIFWQWNGTTIDDSLPAKSLFTATCSFLIPLQPPIVPSPENHPSSNSNHLYQELLPEHVTRTYVISLWKVQEDDDGNDPRQILLTRRLATLPRWAHPRQTIDPVAKVTLSYTVPSSKRISLASPQQSGGKLIFSDTDKRFAYNGIWSFLIECVVACGLLHFGTVSYQAYQAKKFRYMGNVQRPIDHPASALIHQEVPGENMQDSGNEIEEDLEEDIFFDFEEQQNHLFLFRHHHQQQQQQQPTEVIALEDDTEQEFELSRYDLGSTGIGTELEHHDQDSGVSKKKHSPQQSEINIHHQTVTTDAENSDQQRYDEQPKEFEMVDMEGNVPFALEHNSPHFMEIVDHLSAMDVEEKRKGFTGESSIDIEQENLVTVEREDPPKHSINLVEKGKKIYEDRETVTEEDEAMEHAFNKPGINDEQELRSDTLELGKIAQKEVTEETSDDHISVVSEKNYRLDQSDNNTVNRPTTTFQTQNETLTQQENDYEPKRELSNAEQETGQEKDLHMEREMQRNTHSEKIFHESLSKSQYDPPDDKQITSTEPATPRSTSEEFSDEFAAAPLEKKIPSPRTTRYRKKKPTLDAVQVETAMMRPPGTIMQPAYERDVMGKLAASCMLEDQCNQSRGKESDEDRSFVHISPFHRNMEILTQFSVETGHEESQTQEVDIGLQVVSVGVSSKSPRLEQEQQEQQIVQHRSACNESDAYNVAHNHFLSDDSTLKEAPIAPLKDLTELDGEESYESTLPPGSDYRSEDDETAFPTNYETKKMGTPLSQKLTTKESKTKKRKTSPFFTFETNLGSGEKLISLEHVKDIKESATPSPSTNHQVGGQLLGPRKKRHTNDKRVGEIDLTLDFSPGVHNTALKKWDNRPYSRSSIVAEYVPSNSLQSTSRPFARDEVWDISRSPSQRLIPKTIALPSRKKLRTRR